MREIPIHIYIYIEDMHEADTQPYRHGEVMARQVQDETGQWREPNSVEQEWMREYGQQ